MPSGLCSGNSQPPLSDWPVHGTTSGSLAQAVFQLDASFLRMRLHFGFDDAHVVGHTLADARSNFAEHGAGVGALGLSQHFRRPELLEALGSTNADLVEVRQLCVGRGRRAYFLRVPMRERGLYDFRWVQLRSVASRSVAPTAEFLMFRAVSFGLDCLLEQSGTVCAGSLRR